MSTAIVVGSTGERLQTLAWHALDRFVAVRRLRRRGIDALGEKCSSVQFEHHGYGEPPSGVLEWAIRRLAQGVPGGAILSVCPFDKPPPDDLSDNEVAPEAAAIAVSEIVAMQVLCGRNSFSSGYIYRFAVTWNPRPPRQRRIAHTPKLD